MPSDFPCCAPVAPVDPAGAAFRAWNEGTTAPPLAYDDTDLEAAFRAGAAWAAGLMLDAAVTAGEPTPP